MEGAAAAGENRRPRSERNGIWPGYQLHSAEANKPLSRSQKRSETKSDLTRSPVR